MSSKTILVSLFGVIIIGGAMYFSLKKEPASTLISEVLPIQITKQEALPKDTIAIEPSKTASTDTIIDYLVEGQSSNETKTAEAVVDASMPTSSQDSTINTNF